MSSLSSQLAGIQIANASVALDRKKKSKLHSASLIYDPKEASGQDFELIFSTGLDGLDQLSELDSRFNRFRTTLFSETSINVDRNVQTKEQIENLNKTVDIFLALLSPYLNLAPSVKCLEWVLRRFHINIHNPETLLLASLPYYSYPIFTKILYVIPTLPSLFSWLQGYKKLLKNPTRVSMVKGFGNVTFFNLYCQHLIDQLKNKNEFKGQLVFYLSNTIQLVASLTNDLPKLNQEFLPLILEVCGHLLVSESSDCKITAYSIISVLSSITPLSTDIILSITDSVLSSFKSYNTGLQKSTLVILGKLFQTFNDDIPLDASNRIIRKLDPEYFTSIKSIIEEIIEDGTRINNFLFIYANLLVESSDFKNANVVMKFVNLSSGQFKSHLRKLITKIDSTKDKSSISPMVESLIKFDPKLFDEVMKSLKTDVYALEMKLMVTLIEKESANIDEETIEVEITEDVAEEEINWVEKFSSNKTSVKSFINNVDSAEFRKLVQLLVSSINNKKVSEFFESCFSTPESSISFLLAVSISPMVPMKAKVLSVKHLESRLKNLSKDFNLYLLTPLLVCGLLDTNKLVRQYIIGCFEVINGQSSNGDAASKKLFLENEIYSTSSKNAAIIQPKDGQLLVRELTQNIEECAIDGNQIFKILLSIFNLKKIGKLLLAFFINQWQIVQNVLFNYKFLKFINHTLSQIKGAGLKSELFDQFLSSYVSKRDEWKSQALEFKVDFQDFENEVVDLITGKEKSNSEVEFLTIGLDVEDLQVAIDQKLVSIFDSFKTDHQIKLINKYIDLLVNDSDIQIDPISTLQSIEFNNELFVKLLADVQITTSMPEQGIPKRRRKSSTTTRQAMNNNEISSMASLHLKRLTIVLETLEKNSNMTINPKAVEISSPELLQSLFKILSDLEILGIDGKLPVIYLQECLSMCLLSTVINLKNSAKEYQFDSNTIRADLIVNAIRTCNSPVVQKKLLKVISELATLSTSIVLHSVMPIITFIGSRSVKQDDVFSEMLITDTLQSVIPVLAQSGSNITEEIEFLLTSFCASFPHIPRHRRVRLFTTLAETLGPEKSIHIILFLIGQQYVEASSKHKLAEAKSLIEFTSSFVKNFAAPHQIGAMRGFLDLWSEIPTEPLSRDSDTASKLSARSIFGTSILSLTRAELYNMKSKLVLFIDQTITNNSDELSNLPHLKLKIASLLLDNNSEEKVIENILANFKDVLSLVLSILDEYENSSVEQTLIVDNFYRLLSDLLSLLPINYFVDSITSLLSTKSDKSTELKIARHMSILVGKKFELESSVDENAKATAKIMIPVLVCNIESSKDIELSQASLNSLCIMINKYGNYLESSSLLSTLSILTSSCALLHSDPEVIIASLNAITSIISVIGVKSIGLFPKIVPPTINIWKKYNSSAEEEEGDSRKLVETSVLILLSNLVKKIPAFMITSLDSVFKILFESEIVDEAIRSAIIDIIIQHMDLKNVLKSLCNLWSEISVLNPSAIGLYLHTIELTIEHIDKKSASTQSTLFVKFLLSAFEFRAHSELDNNSIHRIEASFFNCGIAYIMKLNDKTFRPLFATIVRWAIDGEGSNSDISEVDRLLAFFRFFNKLQESLKSIVTSYYTYLIESVGKILERFINKKLVDINLRRIILNSLTSSLKYDQDDYWQQQARFDIIAPALINQLSNIEDGIGKYLIKSVAALSQNSFSEEQKKKLNDLLLSHMKINCSPKEKLWAVRTLKMIYQKVGESWVSLLPQLVPVIAELLEDDDEEVEFEVRSGLVKVIESVLGEPLDRYLN